MERIADAQFLGVPGASGVGRKRARSKSRLVDVPGPHCPLTAPIHAVFDRNGAIAFAGGKGILSREDVVLPRSDVRGPRDFCARCGEMFKPIGVLGSTVDREGDLARAQPHADCLFVALLAENRSTQGAGGAGSARRRFLEERIADRNADAERLTFSRRERKWTIEMYTLRRAVRRAVCFLWRLVLDYAIWRSGFCKKKLVKRVF